MHAVPDGRLCTLRLCPCLLSVDSLFLLTRLVKAAGGTHDRWPATSVRPSPRARTEESRVTGNVQYVVVGAATAPCPPAAGREGEAGERGRRVVVVRTRGHWCPPVASHIASTRRCLVC
jgi:hypothetical protein